MSGVAQPGTKGLAGEFIARMRGRGAGASDEAAVVEAALRSDRFRQAREPDWRRLEAIVARLEAGRLSRLSDDDIVALPALYRTVASSLAIARETSLDQATLDWLETLVQRSWFVIYGPRISLWAWLEEFFSGGWSRAVRGIGRDIAIGVAIMVAGTIAGWLIVAADPGWYGALVPAEPGDPRIPGASRTALQGVLYGQHGSDPLAAFAAFLFGHNAQIAILAFALGFVVGIPSLVLLAQNSGMLGAMLWLYHGRGLTLELVAWLSIHGTTELFAILLAAASGLHIGRAIAFPGPRTVLAAAADAGRRAALVMVGVVVMLLVAGMLEGIGRQLITNTYARLAVGGGMLVFWITYFLRTGIEGSSGGDKAHG